MTYNIRACLGTDGARSVRRIGSVIAREEPDIVALQEVDFERGRSGFVDQARALAELIHARAIAGPSFHDTHGSYGNAVLSRLPCRLVLQEGLPHRAGTEPRSAMWLRVEAPDSPVDLINTHLSFRRSDRPRQIEALLGPRWLGRAARDAPTIVCGDLNCTPWDPGYWRLCASLGDVFRVAGVRPRSTWPTRRPFRRIDHILVPPSMAVRSARVVKSPEARLASDHYPLIAEIDP